MKPAVMADMHHLCESLSALALPTPAFKIHLCCDQISVCDGQQTRNKALVFFLKSPPAKGRLSCCYQEDRDHTPVIVDFVERDMKDHTLVQ